MLFPTNKVLAGISGAAGFVTGTGTSHLDVFLPCPAALDWSSQPRIVFRSWRTLETALCTSNGFEVNPMWAVACYHLCLSAFCALDILRCCLGKSGGAKESSAHRPCVSISFDESSCRIDRVLKASLLYRPPKAISNDNNMLRNVSHRVKEVHSDLILSPLWMSICDYCKVPVLISSTSPLIPYLHFHLSFTKPGQVPS